MSTRIRSRTAKAKAHAKTLEQLVASAVGAAIWAAEAAETAAEGDCFGLDGSDSRNARQSADDALEEACAAWNTELNNVSDVKR